MCSSGSGPKGTGKKSVSRIPAGSSAAACSSGGAPFTKDIVYTKGIVQNFNFLRSAIAAGRPDLIRWLFVGKVHLEDVPVLAARAHLGIVNPPEYLPAIFRDLNGLAIWLGISTFWGRMTSATVQEHYEKLFARC